MNYLKVKETTEDEVRLEGYVAIWGGRDLHNEYFTPDTEFESDYTRTGRLYIDFEHGLQPDKVATQPGRHDILGYVDWSTARKDEIGLLVEHVLDRRNKYVSGLIEPLARMKALGTSSEAIPGQVVRTLDGKIEKWPLHRQTLTVTPAEPRTVEFTHFIKSITEEFPELAPELETVTREPVGEGLVQDDIPGIEPKADVPEAIDDEDPAEVEVETEPVTDEVEPEKAIEPEADAPKAIEPEKADETVNKPVEEIEEFIMTDEIKTYLDGLPVLVRETVEEVMKSMPAPRNTEAQGEGRNVKTVGNLLHLVHNRKHEQAEAIFGKTISGLTGADGAFLLPYEINYDLVNSIVHNSRVVAAARRIETESAFGGLPVLAPGAVGAAFVKEGTNISPESLTFDNIEWHLEQLASLIPVTNPMLQDVPLLDSFVETWIRDAMSRALEQQILTGTGAGMELTGIVPWAIANTTGVTQDTADSFNPEDALAMIAAFDAWSAVRPVWLMSPSAVGDLVNFNSATSSYVDYAEGVPASLLGYPIVVSPYMPALGADGAVVLADMGRYGLFTKAQGLEIAFSQHAYFASNTSAFRGVWRVDGKPLVTGPVTLGSVAYSPFVYLKDK